MDPASHRDPLETLDEQSDPFGIEAVNRELNRPRPKLYRRKGLWALVLALVVLVGVRLAIDPLAAHHTQQGLDQIQGYRSQFKKVHVSIFPLSYSIEQLSIRKVKGGDGGDGGTDPVVYAERIELGVKWSKLLTFTPVATAQISKAKFEVKLGETKPPPEVEEATEDVAEELKAKDFDVGAVLADLIPFRINRIEVRDSEFNLIDAKDPSAPRIWMNDIALVLENLASRRSLDQNVPVSLTMKAIVAKTGLLKVLAHADVLSELPAITGQAQLAGLKLSSLHQWTAAKAGVSATGTLNVFANFNSSEGKLAGDIKVLLDHPKLKPATDKVSDAIKARFHQLAINVLGDADSGKNRIATTLPIRGTLMKPDPQVWPTVLGVVRNVMVEGLEWGFRDLPIPTAASEKSLIEQTGKALDPKANAPKAEPSS